VRETIADTLEWWQKVRYGSNLKNGMSRERETRLLALMAGADA
jgi:hypothetical protein